MHCPCESCRRRYREKLDGVCECRVCLGPPGPHQALYNRYRPMALGAPEPKTEAKT